MTKINPFKLRPLKTITNTHSFTSRKTLKQKSENAKDITNRLQFKIDDMFLGSKIKELESNLDLSQLFNSQLKINNEIYKTQAQKSLEMLNELEKNSYKAERDERERWKSIFVMAFENNEAELIRKQEEIIELNSIIAG